LIFQRISSVLDFLRYYCAILDGMSTDNSKLAKTPDDENARFSDTRQGGDEKSPPQPSPDTGYHRRDGGSSSSSSRIPPVPAGGWVKKG